MINSIAILGAGTMGRGIATFFSQKGKAITLFDPYEEALVSVRENLPDNLSIHYTCNLQEAVTGADLIIECAPEDLQIKKQLFASISPFLSAKSIVASNTSTYLLSVLSEDQPFVGRMIITHFFNPGDIIPLVEIVKSKNTEEGVAESVAAFLRQFGKIPVILKRDISGFIANRLQAAVLREACYLLEQGVADPSDIDTVMKESIGIRWALNGPFEIADYGGLDIWEKVLRNLLPTLDNSAAVPAVISEQVKNQNLGLKTGLGFYSHGPGSGNDAAVDRNKKLNAIIQVKKEF